MSDSASELSGAAARTSFSAVRLLERPAPLADGMASMNDVLLNTVTRVYLQTHTARGSVG